MQWKDFWSTLKRRWYLVLVAVLVAGGAGVLVSNLIGPTYQVQSTVLLLPPGTTVTGGTATTGNPYLSLGGVSQARDVVIRSLMSGTTHDELCAASGDAAFKAMQSDLCKNNPEVTYTATPDFTSSAPMILMTVEANTEANAVAALTAVTDVVPTKLSALQAGLNLPDRALITSTPVVVDKNPTPVRKAQIRASIAVVGAVLAAGLLAIALLEGLIGSRKPRRVSPTPSRSPAAERAAGWGWDGGDASRETNSDVKPPLDGAPEPDRSARVAGAPERSVAETTAKR